MNKYICIGRLGNDPEIIDKGCKLRVAVKSSTEDALWLSVFVFGVCAEHCLKYKKKGELLGITGRLELSKNGNLVVISHDVEFI